MNVAGWQVLARLLGFDPERVAFPSLPEVGHMVSGDNIVNLKMLHEAGKLRRRDRIVLATAGYGLHWHCVILETM
jgi:3-oxoacyl-[acyl-carrier-protein] synthase III